jgi:hypothetical protein
LLSACSYQANANHHKPEVTVSQTDAQGQVSFIGKIVHLDLEGGFYGIVSKNQQFDPINLPEQFKQPGLLVRVQGKIQTDSFSMRQWGLALAIKHIAKAN